MLLSKPQQQRFWREWSTIKGQFKAQGHTDAQIENERYAMLERAGFDSLTQVDPAAGFDKVLAELAAINNPADLSAQLRQAQMPRTRLLYAIQKLDRHFSKSSIRDSLSAISPYTQAIMEDRFNTTELDRLSLSQLQQLRNTLAARKSATRDRARDAAAIKRTQRSLAALGLKPDDNEPF
jgi:hypothetical protein